MLGAAHEPLTQAKPMSGAKANASKNTCQDTGSALPVHGLAQRPAAANAAARSAAVPAPHMAGNLAIQHLFRTSGAQAKFAISHPGDADELEADRVADQVMRSETPGPIGSSAGTVQRQCAACESARAPCPKCADEQKIQCKARVGGASASNTLVRSLRGGGQPLAGPIRAFFEPHFGKDLGGVRVHTDGAASSAAEAINARAFTHGGDIAFAQDQFAPETSDGKRLLAHELTHVVQQGGPGAHAAPRIQRQAAPPAAQTPQAPLAGQAQPAQPAAPVPQGEIIKTLDGVQLVEDAVFMRYQLEQLVVKGSGDAYYRFYKRLERDVETDEMAGDRAFKKQYEADPAVPAGVPRAQEDFDAYAQRKVKEKRVLEIVRPIAEALDLERDKVVADFEQQLKDRARATLAESKKQAQAEAARYGIKWETIEGMMADCMFGDCKTTSTSYSMGTNDEQSPEFTGFQGAAQILLGRRKELDDASDQLDAARRAALDNLASCAGEGAGAYAMECPGQDDLRKRREAAEETHKKKKDNYDLWSGLLADKYPILAVFSDPEKSTDDLKALSTQKAGPEIAALVGKQIVDRLNKIAKVENGLNDSDEVNVWRLPPLMRVTSELTGVNNKPVWKKWVDEKTAKEQPGAFWSIALAVLNIAAIVAAPATGGLSLAAVAGVNAVVAVQHIKEYQMEKALAGTAFDKARALSQDDPSFFWLAVEIVGVAVDVVSAFKAVSAAAKALKAAEEIGDAKRIADATADLKKSTELAGGEKLTTRVMGQLGEHGAAEGKALKALEATAEETRLLNVGAEAANTELKAGVIGGNAAAGLPVKISRNGHIFSCHSPCEWMISNYAALLGPDITIKGEKLTLRAQFLILEEEAAQAAKAVRSATPAQLAEMEAAAAAVERKIATFDEKLAQEAAYSEATKKFGALDPEVAAKLLGLEKGMAIRLAGVDAAVLEQIGKLEAESLNKIASWGLDGAALNRILEKGANPGHVKGQLLEELLNVKMAKPGELAKHVPAGLVEKLESQGAKLEFIPGHSIADADGRLITDGIIGYWEGDRLKIVTFFEAKGGAPSARGLRTSWTGIPKAERAELYKKAEDLGLDALRKDQTYQDLGEALSEAASDVKHAKKAAAKLSLDEVIKQFPNDVKKAWSNLPQTEAGQITKTTERLTEGGGTLKINGKDVQTSTIGGRKPRAVGVLPAGVTEDTLEATLKKSGITNFERLQEIPQAELNDMASKLAGTAKPKPLP